MLILIDIIELIARKSTVNAFSLNYFYFRSKGKTTCEVLNKMKKKHFQKLLIEN
jgi:hypothetical protein